MFAGGAVLYFLRTLAKVDLGPASSRRCPLGSNVNPHHTPMLVLYVHGMGRSPMSGWPMLRQLRKAGLSTAVFGYVAALESFESIVHRLRARLQQLSKRGPYVVAGHSLGGVLLRAALASMPEGASMPKHIFLLGSPIKSSRLATKLKTSVIFRMLTGDCGQLLASSERMDSIPPVSAPATAIIGVNGFNGRFGPFGAERNDGIVSVSEVSADWIRNTVEVPHLHTFLPASSSVAEIIIENCVANAG